MVTKITEPKCFNAWIKQFCMELCISLTPHERPFHWMMLRMPLIRWWYFYSIWYDAVIKPLFQYANHNNTRSLMYFFCYETGVVNPLPTTLQWIETNLVPLHLIWIVKDDKDASEWHGKDTEYKGCLLSWVRSVIRVNKLGWGYNQNILCPWSSC